ncbi:uncharacterized protein PAC_11340 [Phialocephala subalpina]|uniref:Protein kinase domain-containing protein n=1 Tax=Phialocephala subalpina TaxID=576137 RepID=A0A1L7X8U9_9HELO|nr:uncharacterized protein PAC_11340 [Phialocephala subalpina]
MESLFSLPLPFQRRLTKMYTDTKTSYEFVKEPINTPQEDPELQVLHRKLRIQKDRLVSWGLEWSDPEQSTSPDIDESINKAGLSELVGSVMGTIKEILAEAEPLWAASRRIGASGDVGEKGEKSKSALIIWDKSRFQDLIRDLTMSIDTLYDLSRTRQSARKIPETRKEEESMMAVQKKVIEERQFESSRMQTPQQVDPKSIIWPREMKTMPAGMLPPAKSNRQIVFMRRPTTSLQESRKIGMGGQSFPAVPVLLEYAPYDPIYSITGITPSLTRFEKLFAALSQSYISTGRILVGLLGLIGYFEEPEHSRFCLLYALPTHFGPIDIESPRMPSITILSDLLYSQNYEPSLEVKYRLAYNVASAVFDLHAKGVVHGNVVASNILFIEHQPQNRLDLSQVNMRQSYLTSCDLFSDNATDSSDTSPDPLSLYRHSLDPRTTRYTRLTSESKSLDLYSLAMLLLEIGLWTSLHDIFPMASAIPENPVGVLKQLAARCGSLYVKAVQACWNAPNDELSQRARPDVMHQKVFFKVSKALDTCCAIDESSDESTEESDDSPPIPSTPLKASRSSTPLRKPITEKKSTIALNVVPSTSTQAGSRPSWSEKSSYGKSPSSFPEKMGWSEKPVVKAHASTPIPEKAKSKLRTYPSLKISPELLDFWQSGLLPHINHVLRGFYRKYPESVEISLESIGETPATAKPTILVICTSVTKVRSILKKHLAYDKQVFGLKVCRGKVVRSRKHGTKRSMGHDSDVLEAANPGHQECPTNGASIGAYVDEKHLPPVSLGGMIIIDDKPYGMTVHHMLDDPSDNEDDESLDTTAPILRSSAYGGVPDLTFSESSIYSGDEEFMYTLSDFESDIDDNSSIHSSEYDSDDEDLLSLSAFDENQDDEEQAPGDIPGVPIGCGESYSVTQPAIDDIPSDFYPDPSTRDEDHLDSFQLGSIYASSGIRRRTENGVVHEVDWALFSYSSSRLPTANSIPGGSRYLPSHIDQSSYPTAVKRTDELSNMPVHCLARTSGLQAGRISQSMVSVKIFGRQSPSLSYQVSSHQQKLGIPGDSGAWVIGNDGEVCGCVLAWSTKKGVAYICPMDVLLRDIGITLKAKTVKLPRGEVVYERVGTQEVEIQEPEPRRGRQQIDVLDESEITKMLQELKLPPTPTQIDDLDPSTIQQIAGLYPSHSPSPSEGQERNERALGKERERDNQKEDMSFLPMRMMSSGHSSGQKGRVSVSERSMIPQRVREGLSVSSS